jgi:phosphonate metabolism protein PhnN/1,5-bisphosphokinase (PRPP-forming)
MLSQETPGLMVLVVGPSGAGKDTLMQAAAHRLQGDERYVFFQRVLTRDAKAGGEDHLPMTEDKFRDAFALGAFCLSWRAHGLAYGIPISMIGALRHGRTTIVNVSRHMISAAEDIWPRVGVIYVDADVATREQRIAARKRELAADIMTRLTRTVEFSTRRAPVLEVQNNGSIDAGVALFVSALGDLANRTL